MGQPITMAARAFASDAELLEASRRGEHSAFGALVARYQDVVCAVTYSRTRDQALSEDVAQETFLAAWRQLDQLREPGSLRAWLCGIARNLARKARRRSDREPVVTPDAMSTVDDPLRIAGATPFDAVCEAEAERVVGAALGRVPERYRDVLVLYYREQRPIRDVASLLGISEAAALQRLARGRQHLAEGLTSLVERSLRGQRPRRDLVACVTAALPFAVPSRVEAQPTTGGTMLIKLALAAAALSAAGTTAYVLHDGRTDARPTAAAASPIAAEARDPRAPAVARAAPSTTPAPAHAAPAAPSLAVPGPDAPRAIEHTTLDRLGVERGPSRGAADAPVTIAVFTDLQCKYCGMALGALDQLLDEYPRKVRVVVKQLPVHPTAELAAEASFAAEAQGKFWELHDLMLANQDDLSRDALLALAAQAGLDVARFRTALDQHAYADALARDVAAARELAIQGTPTFIIGGRLVNGMRPIADLRAAIDAALADG